MYPIKATKKWLETHVFHAKRFHMETLFGFALPVSSNDKSARSMYRSVTSHSIIHDASYTRMIQLETAGGGGNEGLNAIIELMQGVTDPSLPGVGSKQFIFGNRFGGTVLYSTSKNWPAGAIAPIDFLWKRGGGGRRGGGRGGGGDGASADSSTHTLWIFVHPSAFNQALKALQETNASLSSSSCQGKEENDFA